MALNDRRYVLDKRRDHEELCRRPTFPTPRWQLVQIKPLDSLQRPLARIPSPPDTTHADFLSRQWLERRVFGHTRNNKERDFLSVHVEFNVVFWIDQRTAVESRLLFHLTQPSATVQQNKPRLTSRIAHKCFGSSLFIFPFGNPHEAFAFHPLTKTTYHT